MMNFKDIQKRGNFLCFAMLSHHKTLYFQEPGTKLATCNMSTHDIKNKITMTFLSERMAKDAEFWTS
jgi:hypothetical protein